jgi:phage gpG-like protein
MARAAFSVEATVFGEKIVTRRFVRFQAAALDMSGPLRQVAGILADSTRENFRTRGVSGGSKWRDLNERYAARTGRAPGERILRLTERLYGSLVGAEGATGAARGLSGRFVPGGGEHIEEVTPDSLRWGSSVPYGVYHQSSAPRTKIPYRPPVRLSERHKREVVKVLQRALVEGSR